MLTEEAIKETRFFQGADEKVYLVVEVRKVKLVTLIETIDSGESQLLLDDEEVCSQFSPVFPKFQTFVQNQRVPDKPTGYRKPKRTRGGGPPSSQFKGVKKLKKGYADGRDRWYASWRNPQTKKQEYLGSFDNEYLAAAAWFERDGDKAEAKRLRALVKEHQELNPDRPLDGAARHDAKRQGKTIFVCKRCGLEYQSKGICAACGNSDMRKVLV